MKLIAILFIALFGIALGSVSHGDHSSKDHPGKCVINGKIFEPGTHNNPSETECYRVECSASGHAETANCGVQSFGGNCKDEGYLDVSKPYPECCERKVVCSD